MKFREQTAKKKSIRQIAGMFLAVTVLLAGSPYIAEAAEIVKDMDGTAYAQDAAGFVYQIRKKAVPFICIREKKAQLPFLQNVIPT